MRGSIHAFKALIACRVQVQTQRLCEFHTDLITMDLKGEDQIGWNCQFRADKAVYQLLTFSAAGWQICIFTRRHHNEAMSAQKSAG